MDFTEQGGLMWGEHAIGKLAAGDDPLKPQARAFVDEEAGDEVAEKVQRRLQHFIDRRVAVLFEPLLDIQRDEALSGQARGFGFRMIENIGVIDRRKVADDVKALDQETRGALRKHGVRFGQFTIFMPLLLKPAPTRLRLVLWALAKGLEEFPESPPPGLVTIPAQSDADPEAALMSGYKPAGDRAIRIDMLERLADMLRKEDSRGGFEANADMLSITGMTLEQFAGLMEGLGYRAERGEREKIRPDPKPEESKSKASEAGAAAPETANAAEDAVTEEKSEAEAPEVAEQMTGVTPTLAEPKEPPTEADEGPTIEVFFKFAWGGNRGRAGPRQGSKPQRKERPKGKPRPKGDAGGKPKSYQDRPPRKDKIDPDNPFAQALMGLKDKGS